MKRPEHPGLFDPSTTIRIEALDPFGLTLSVYPGTRRWVYCPRARSRVAQPVVPRQPLSPGLRNGSAFTSTLWACNIAPPMRTQAAILWVLLGLLCGAVGLSRPLAEGLFVHDFHDAGVHLHAHDGSLHLHAYPNPETLGHAHCSLTSCEIGCCCHDHQHHGQRSNDDAIPNRTRETNPTPTAIAPDTGPFLSWTPPREHGQFWSRVPANARAQLLHLRTVVLLT